ncbi:MAG: MopE-related protein [Chitinophagales bacterium]
MRAKVYPMEESIRVPLFVRYPPWFAPGTTVDNDLAELIDIPKTLLDLANVPDTFNFQGISLRDLYGPDTLRKYARFEFGGSNEDITMAPAIRGVRSFNYLYADAHCDCYEEEFYDLVNDPLEDHNLIFDPQYAGLVEQYRNILDSMMLAVDDTGPLLQMPCYLVNAIEIPDGLDNDCDGLVDDSLGTEWTKYLDLDHDGYGEDAVTLISFVTPEDYADVGGDCMDNNAMVNPGMPEICGDGLDNNCNGLYDEVDYVATISPADTAYYCKGSFVELTAGPSGVGYSYQWYKNGSLITGATSMTYSVYSPGSFQVVVTSGSCATYSTPTISIKLNNPKPKIKLKSLSNNLLLNSPVKLATSNIPGYTYQWYLNGSVLTGATGFKYFATVPGYYTVRTVDLDGCSILSDEYLVINVLREGEALSPADLADLQLYPNPASDRVHAHLETIWTDQSADALIRITDMYGKEIMSIHTGMSAGVVDEDIALPAGIATGVYTLSIQVNGYNWVKDMIVQ